MRKPVDQRAAALMVVLCLVWGFQQVAIKAVVADVHPVLQMALRFGVAAPLVWLFSRLVVRDTWLSGIGLRSGVGVGILFAAEFLCIAEGLRFTTASHMVVFIYTAPIFAAIGLHLKLDEERMPWLQWVGILLAFAGIGITFLGGHGRDPAAPNWLLGDSLGLCAGAAWGLTTVAVRTTRMNDAPAAQTLFHQLFWGFVLLLSWALITGQDRFHGTTLAWASLAYQTFIISFASYLAWFWLLRVYLAAPLGVLSFMSPLFGVAMGAVLLHEPLDRSFVIGAVLVISGLVVVNGQALVRQGLARASGPGRELLGARGYSAPLPDQRRDDL